MNSLDWILRYIRLGLLLVSFILFIVLAIDVGFNLEPKKTVQ